MAVGQNESSTLAQQDWGTRKPKPISKACAPGIGDVE